MGSFTSPSVNARTNLAPGERLDRYELLCVLAQGGMGTVWLARMTGKHGFERLVALKTILPSYSHDEQFGAMFLDEAKIAAQIDHENVARILEIGEDGGLLYYAMELIDGESLRKVYRDVRAADVPFPMGVALRIVADACAGLHATHELVGEDGQPLHVVHRDVSPQNLLVSVRGTTKLIDFGVAKASSRRSEETAAGTLKGKLEYMAPEQARGEPLDRRADVYALGAVLYELLAGRPVHDTGDGKQLIALHELMTGVAYEPLPQTVPQLVRGVVDRALARDPERRFGTAEELRRALEQAMLATGQGATPEDVAGVLAHFSRDRTSKRKDAIERALRAASEGQRKTETLVAPLSVRGVSTVEGMAPGMGSTRPGTPVSAVLMAGASGPISVAPLHPLNYPVPVDTIQTGPSIRSLGAASMSSHPMPGSSLAKVFAGVLVLAMVAVLGVVAGVLVTRRGQKTTASPSNKTATVATSALTGVPVATSPDGVPPAAAEPSAPTTGASANEGAATGSAHAARDAGAAAAAGSGKKPSGRLPAKPGTKQGDGDEYGF